MLSSFFTWYTLSGFECLSRAVKHPGLSLLSSRLRGQCITIKNQSCNSWACSDLILSTCGDGQSNTGWPKEFPLNQREPGVSSALSSTAGQRTFPLSQVSLRARGGQSSSCPSGWQKGFFPGRDVGAQSPSAFAGGTAEPAVHIKYLVTQASAYGHTGGRMCPDVTLLLTLIQVFPGFPEMGHKRQAEREKLAPTIQHRAHIKCFPGGKPSFGNPKQTINPQAEFWSLFWSLMHFLSLCFCSRHILAAAGSPGQQCGSTRRSLLVPDLAQELCLQHLRT